MSFITDLIKEKAGDVLNGNSSVSIPDNLKDKVFGGVADSIFESIKQTASKEGGIGQLTELLTGKQSAATSPVTSLAGKIFSSDIVKKIGLSPEIGNVIVQMLPKVIEQFSSSKRFDLDSLIKEAGTAVATNKLKEAAGGLFGKLFK